MIKSGGSLRRRRSPGTFPSIQGDVMVITARGEERSAVPQPLYNLEPEYAVIKVNCPRKIGDLQMDMADPRPRIHRLKRHTHYATLPT